MERCLTQNEFCFLQAIHLLKFYLCAVSCNYHIGRFMNLLWKEDCVWGTVFILTLLVSDRKELQMIEAGRSAFFSDTMSSGKIGESLLEDGKFQGGRAGVPTATTSQGSSAINTHSCCSALTAALDAGRSAGTPSPGPWRQNVAASCCRVHTAPYSFLLWTPFIVHLFG